MIIIIIKKGRQCKAESELYTLSVRRPQLTIHSNDRKKRKGKRVEDYSRD